MVQIIGEGRTKPLSTSQKLGRGLSDAFNMYVQQAQEKKNLAQENAAAERMGIDLAGIRDPKMRQQILAEELKGRNDIKKADYAAFVQGQRDRAAHDFQMRDKDYSSFMQGKRDRQNFENQKYLLDRKYQLEEGLKNKSNNIDLAEDERTYNTIKQTWGPQAADIYRAATEGGKTKILDTLLEAGQRGLKFEDILPKIESIDNENLNKDYDKGLTSKERVERQEKRYTINLPLYQESKKRLDSLESEKDKLNILQDLSPNIGGLDKLNINPTTGELIIPSFASDDAQRYVKTLNDFTTLAKDSYGSRVTNFDLNQFMKRLPSLANSSGARDKIIRQMNIINDINRLKEKTLQDVIDKEGGIRNIDFDKAESIADKKSNDKINKLKSEFKLIDKDLENEYQKTIKSTKNLTPQGMVAVQKADGSQGYIPNDKLEEFLKIPGNRKL